MCRMLLTCLLLIWSAQVGATTIMLKNFDELVAEADGILIGTNLIAGVYYLHVRNTGLGNPLAPPPEGYTSYGSVGQYFIQLVAPNSDSDQDGILDSNDNCILVANPTQIDSDADGYGNHCDGDLNNNGFTNAQDYVLFRAQLGQPSVAPTYNAADLNGNGFVNAQDAVLFQQMLNQPSGPSGIVP